MHAYILDELMKSNSNHRDESDHILIWSPVPCLQIQTSLFLWKQTLHIKINVLILYCIMKKNDHEYHTFVYHVHVFTKITINFFPYTRQKKFMHVDKNKYENLKFLKWSLSKKYNVIIISLQKQIVGVYFFSKGGGGCCVVNFNYKNQPVYILCLVSFIWDLGMQILFIITVRTKTQVFKSISMFI